MRTFALALFAGIAAAGLQSKLEYQFIQYISQYNKQYATYEEYLFRMEQFAKTVAGIESHDPTATYTVGFNKMSDWSEAEYKSILGLKGVEVSNKVHANSGLTAPAEVNWVTAGAVTGVKDQGQCGSCWAFSCTGTLEGAHEISTGTLLSFSEQQLVSCVNTCMGCGGGWQSRGFVYYENHNAELESTYPYTSGTGTNGACLYSQASATSVIATGWTSVTADSIPDMMDAVAQQPVSVSIEADTLSFQRYKTGVYNNVACGTTLDHAVLTVGYGTDPVGGDYWLVKNSWGTSWGENGYIKIARVAGPGICGIQMGPLYVSV